MEKYGIVLAAGKGTRMKSDKPKCAHLIFEKPMIGYVCDALQKSEIKNIITVIGYKGEVIKDILGNKYLYAEQKEQLGTGHAVKSAVDHLQGKKGVTIITAGDMPLITGSTFNNLLLEHQKNNNKLTILSAKLDDPTGYGRIIKEEDKVKRVIEHNDCDYKQLKINEVNLLTWCIDTEMLLKYINDIENNNEKEEYYLTDLVDIFNKNNLPVGAYQVTNNDEIINVNTMQQLATATNVMKNNINDFHMSNGVNIINPVNTYIGPDVKIGSDTIIYPQSYILGNSNIGRNNSIKSSYIIDSTIGDDNEIGPYAHIRNNCIIGNNIRIGNFVEIKKSTIKDNTKSAHHTYIGDSEVGSNVNIGCGVITVNYDGTNKHKTRIGDDCFIGSNVNLVAPINIDEGSVVGAGSTITKNVPANSLAIARERETIKTNYIKNKK